MKFSPKKIIAALLSAVLVSGTSAALPLESFAAESVRYEFENGTNSGATVEKNQSGYSGTGYVYLKDAGQYTQVTVNTDKAGLYEVNLCYYLPANSGSKSQDIYVNGTKASSMSFATTSGFKTISAGKFSLKAGSNTIKIVSTWGWTMFDYLTINEAVLPALTSDNTLSDANATDSTQGLMNYLCDVYGHGIISGQQELYGDADETEFDYIYNATGKYPAIRGFDYMNWSQAQNTDDGTNDRIIDWVNNKGGIATVCWHWFVPSDMSTYTASNLKSNSAFYSSGTNFSPKKAVTAGTAENTFINTDIAKIAKAIKELQDNDIPIIFRPFHEAEGSSSLDGSGSWFWWGTDGAETYKTLWKYLYNKLTKEYGLHNIIWEWNSYDYSTSTAWYPGDDYVDLVGYDKYNANGNTPNESAISTTFYNLVEQYDGKKMVAMAENDTIPSLTNLVNEKAGWLYFCPWYEKFITSTKYNSLSSLKELYQSDYVITRDELPDYKNYSVTAKTDISKLTAALSQTQYTYNGTAKKPSVTISGLKSGTDFSVSYSDNVNAGTGTVTIRGIGNYKGTVTKAFTISKASISTSSVSGIVSKTYTGSSQTQNITVKYGTKTLVKNTDYTVFYTNNIKAGTANITITGKGNYSGTIKKSFSISRASITSSSVSGISTKTYSGKTQTQNVTVKLGTKTLVKNTDYTVSYKNNKYIGKATVTIKGIGNYTGTITKTFKIIPKKQAIVSSASKSKAFRIRWTKDSQATGYQISYSTSSSMSSAKSVWIKSKTTVAKTVSGLKAKKYYYVRVRTYKTVNGVKYYGNWSTIKKIKTK